MAETYCIDTSSVSEIRHFRRDVFPAIWSKIEDLVRTGRLIAPHEVLRELSRGHEDVYEWARAQDMFVEIDDDQVAQVRVIRSKFSATDIDATDPSADELLVALVISRTSGLLLPDKHVVVTEESKGGRGSSKVPNICEEFGVECIKLADLLSREGPRY